MIRRSGLSSSWSYYQLGPLLLLLLQQALLIDATIYLHNDTYASLPGLFGKILMENRIYEARLQFLPENPYLCEPVNLNESSFVMASQVTTSTTNDDTNGETTTMMSADPIVLIASRGQCPFQRKASIAEAIDPSVQYLIVHNFNIEGSSDDALVPMYSEFGDTRLALLSVTHRAGIALKRHIAEQPPDIQKRGGPWVSFDNLPPEGLLSVEELRNMLLSALGLFFMLISFSGCILIAAGTYGHVQMEGSRIVFTTHPPGEFGPHVSYRRNALLTEAQVRTVSETMKKNEATTRSEDNNSTGGNNDEDHHCAVCIDELDDSSEIMTLPCQHQFHTDCLLPWLTERQSKCPLCKFDVMEYVRQQELQMSSDGDEIHGKAPSWWDRILRYRWTTVATTTTPHEGTEQREGEEDTSTNSIHGGVAVAPTSTTNEGAAELELTEQRRFT